MDLRSSSGKHTRVTGVRLARNRTERWKIDVDARAGGIAFDVQPSLIVAHDHRDAGEPKAGGPFLGAEERIERTCARVAKQPVAGVSDGDANEALRARWRSDRPID